MECRSAARNGITLVILVTATIFLVIDAGVVCTITELAPCTGDFASPQEPSSACCVKVKSQQTCFCQYADDPVSTGCFLAMYYNSLPESLYDSDCVKNCDYHCV
uniref:Bifunctional inhibitor/plant lipid transfer protein/seed storage helical domain-containing protein n=1 Tax=Daucus carota subsp. sativus TaxID=79200 RepID=A0A166AUS7_DAUCS